MRAGRGFYIPASALGDGLLARAFAGIEPGEVRAFLLRDS